MAKKGAFKREKEEKQYIYWMATPHPSLDHLLSRIKNKIFDGKSLTLVTYLIENDSEFSEEDLKEIEKLIEKRRTEWKRRLIKKD